jgi:hypothetical protein
LVNEELFSNLLISITTPKRKQLLLIEVPYFNEKTDMVILDGAAVEGCSLVNLLHKHEVAVETHFGQYLKLINFVMLYRL